MRYMALIWLECTQVLINCRNNRKLLARVKVCVERIVSVRVPSCVCACFAMGSSGVAIGVLSTDATRREAV